eukprot:PLAT10504.1.p1 GENE.PLAT10504.1~~PLAT10504.1.p1  ORF type:complete len:692 (-),score=292.08 PLAT10504.1:1297-3156(-)
MDASFSFLTFFALGYGFAYGSDVGGAGFVGGDRFFLLAGDDEYVVWFFQACFAATAATIVSGAVAERTRFAAYICFSTVLTMFIYPIVAHWVWSPAGWLSAARPSPLLGVGVVDYAGSAVVHLVGGVAGFAGIAVIGSRHGFLDSHNKAQRLHGQSLLYSTLGTFILWFGWFAFNAGSTLRLTGGGSQLVGRILINTTLSAAAAGATATLWVGRRGRVDITVVLNATLAGLVSVTAGCASFAPGFALLVGVLGSVLFMLTSEGMLRWKMDDPLDAFAIHGAGGAWGTLAVGLFSADSGLLTGHGAAQLGAQLVAVLSITGWTAVTTVPLFLLLERFIGLRPSLLLECLGMEDGLEYSALQNLAASEFRTMMLDSRHPLLPFFHAFLCSELAAEQLDFVLVTGWFRDSMSSAADTETERTRFAAVAAEIVEMYLRPGAEFMANVSDHAAKRVIRKVAAGDIGAWMFDSCQREVTELLERGPWARFIALMGTEAAGNLRQPASGYATLMSRCSLRRNRVVSIDRYGSGWTSAMLSEHAGKAYIVSSCTIMWRDNPKRIQQALKSASSKSGSLSAHSIASHGVTRSGKSISRLSMPKRRRSYGTSSMRSDAATDPPLRISEV